LIDLIAGGFNHGWKTGLGRISKNGSQNLLVRSAKTGQANWLTGAVTGD
jgi:hypothetical protein